MNEPVARYFGAQIEAAPQQLRIVVMRPTRGLAGKLWNTGWTRQRSDGAFVKRATPEAFASARAILRAFYGEPMT
ncbi:MAG: hypothetical protein WCA81_05705 [Rhizomicrobium sp.]|jgi:hypothetical protein